MSSSPEPTIGAVAVRRALPPPFPRALHEEALTLLMARFDGNGDGKLDAGEAQSLRDFAEELFARKKKAILTRYDRNGNGKLDPDEEAALRKDWEKEHPGIGRLAMRKEREERRSMRLIQIRRFDADGDGRLNENERAAMRDWVERQRREGALPPPPPPEGEWCHEADPARKEGDPHPVRAERAHELPPEAGIVLEHLLLERYDTDRDGFLSSSEIEAALSRRPAPLQKSQEPAAATSPPPPSPFPPDHASNASRPEPERGESGLDERR